MVGFPFKFVFTDIQYFFDVMRNKVLWTTASETSNSEYLI